MGGACSTNGERRNAYRILVGNQDVDGWTILTWILREVGWDSRDWIDLAQDRDRWRAYVNAVMNLRVP
jgi:hypothetical protein